MWNNRTMYPITLIFFISFFFFLHHFVLITAADDIAVNCGSSDTSIALDGRQWVGDMGSQSTFSRQPNGKSIWSKVLAPQPLLADPIPYMTACISTSQFAYTFRVSAGQKFIRLHFYPASYPGFERSKAIFTVKAGPYTLLSNFSASLTADALGLKSFAKEFCVNFEENQELIISFSPSSTRASGGMYAFVNGIEILSMPSGLYYTPDGEPGAQVVGQKHRFPIDNSTALELVERLNIGGSSILSVEDWAMFRRWSGDSYYLLEPSGLLPTAISIPVKYTKIPSYSAPQKVYQTAWSMDPNKQANKMCNLTWKLPVDLGFRYLVRLHFCELNFELKGSGQREFVIFINNKIVEARADEEGVAVYSDYMMKMDGNRMEGKSYLLIALQSHHHTVAVLNGIEVFKLSNPDNILAGQNPEPLAHASMSTTPKLQNLLLAFGNWNAIVSCLIILITSLNIIVYQLRLWAENVGQIDISSKSEELCRRFSLVEIQVATNNFDDVLIIGEGGFGKVYKGVINKGATIVAIKRLRSMSKQGAEEFWTEIKMLSNLRHTHLVTLIGYCNDGEEMILVYEYMVNGTLADHLHKINRNGNGSIPPLSWEQRLNICIGAAAGLEYLHTGAQHRVIHRDVKTSNILLDENWVAKISDFGLSKMGGTSTTNQSSTCIITEVKGTFGYLDVEYFLTQRLTRKSDVYAFGVVLFEVLCGRPAVDKRFEGEERSLALWAQHCIKERELDQIIDPAIKGQISPHCLKIFVEIANKCLHNRPKERPSMSHVMQRLEFALISQGHSPYSSTDTDGEGEEEKLIDVSMDVSVPIDSITEEEEVENVINEITLPTDTQQLTGFPISVQDSTDRPEERANKKMFSIRRAFRGMNLWRRKKNDNNLSSSGSIIEAKTSQTKAKTSQVLPGGPYLAEFSPEPACRIFSLREIKEATKNFHRDLIMRHGGPDHGEMYRGYIDDGEFQVAIERCTIESESNFLQEVELRSRIHHQHITSFMGYCKDFAETILVYEYMAKGSLGDYLHGTCIDTLPWQKRVEICLGSAQALQYLHTCSQEPIIHGELTSNSILLDEKWVAKVSGLKVSELDPSNSGHTRTVVTTVIQKTLGYVDPEYLLSGRLTTKSDVYSFGVVLLEVLCAREPQCTDQVKKKRNLVEWFKICIQKKKIDEVIDPYLIGKIAPHSLKEYVRIADKCLLFRGVERPSMDDVIRRLQLALKQQEKAGEFIKFGGFGDPQQTSIAAATRAYNKVL